MLLEKVERCDDCATRQPIRIPDDARDRGRSPKGPSIYSLLKASVGKPWNEVFSKICQSRKWNNFRKVMDLKWFVNQSGRPNCESFFVDENGILRKNQWRFKNRIERKKEKVVMLSVHEFAYCVKGVWYAYSYNTLSNELARALHLPGQSHHAPPFIRSNGSRDPVSDTQRTLYLHGRHYYCARTRIPEHLEQEMIKSLNISINIWDFEPEQKISVVNRTFFFFEGSWRVLMGKKRQLGKREIKKHKLREMCSFS